MAVYTHPHAITTANHLHFTLPSPHRPPQLCQRNGETKEPRWTIPIAAERKYISNPEPLPYPQVEVNSDTNMCWRLIDVNKLMAGAEAADRLLPSNM